MNIKKIISTIGNKAKSYNYSEHWKESGKTYADKFVYSDSFKVQEEALLKLSKRLGFKSVFEIGCGFGRITKLLMDNYVIEKYDAIDISEHQIQRARHIEGVSFAISDFMGYIPKRKYDLVIASEVLMHIPPNLIGGFTKKMIDMSNHFVLSIDVFGTNQKLARHNFVHSYPDLYQKHIVESTNLNNGQYMFLVIK